jgi:hypothetical protein
MKRINFLLAAAFAVFMFSSCQKDSTSTNPIVTSATDDDQVTTAYDDVDAEVDDITSNSGTLMSTAPSPTMAAYADDASSRSVVTAVNDDGSVTKTITYVNWTNPNANNGHVKNGVIVINIVGGPLQAQYSRTVTFQNFTIDDNLIEGTRLIQKIADYQYTVTLTGGKITFADGTTYTREANRTRTWISGMDTPYNIWDDVFSIEGSETGVNRQGETYTHTIVNALQIRRACRWIVAGTMDIVVGDKTATLDYGNGDCDNLATVTINGEIYDIKLRGGKK